MEPCLSATACVILLLPAEHVESGQPATACVILLLPAEHVESGQPATACVILLLPVEHVESGQPATACVILLLPAEHMESGQPAARQLGRGRPHGEGCAAGGRSTQAGARVGAGAGKVVADLGRHLHRRATG